MKSKYCEMVKGIIDPFLKIGAREWTIEENINGNEVVLRLLQTDCRSEDIEKPIWHQRRVAMIERIFMPIARAMRPVGATFCCAEGNGYKLFRPAKTDFGEIEEFQVNIEDHILIVYTKFAE